MKVNEIFYSIQGESTWVGRPMIFIRLTGCNLRCVYCDTAYAFDEGKEMTITEIMREVMKFDCKYVCVTGGEPLVQRNDLSDLIDTLNDNDYHVSLETNGTMNLEHTSALPDKVVMDIKCPSSGVPMESHKAIVYQNLAKWLTPDHDEVKFVFNPMIINDLDFVEEWMERIRENMDVIFSPVIECHEGLTPEQRIDNLSKMLQQIAAWVLKRNFKQPVRVLPQLHKIIWPNIKRGV